MRDKYRPRRVLLVLAALVLPAATCGVAPALKELIGRVNLLETRALRLERFAANAQLPHLLVDERDLIVGTVLEYNDMFLYASVNRREGWSPWTNREDWALATLQLSVPGHGSLVLDANRDELLAPVRGQPETLFFESEDCTGTPYAWRISPPFDGGRTVFTRAWIGTPGKILYALRPDPELPTQQVAIRSAATSAGIVEPVSGCWQYSNVWSGALWPFTPIADLSQYTPPFRIVDQREFFGF